MQGLGGSYTIDNGGRGTSIEIAIPLQETADRA